MRINLRAMLFAIAVVALTACGAGAELGDHHVRRGRRNARAGVDPDLRTAWWHPSPARKQRVRHSPTSTPTVFDPVPPDQACTMIFGGPRRRRYAAPGTEPRSTPRSPNRTAVRLPAGRRFPACSPPAMARRDSAAGVSAREAHPRRLLPDEEDLADLGVRPVVRQEREHLPLSLGQAVRIAALRAPNVQAPTLARRGQHWLAGCRRLVEAEDRGEHSASLLFADPNRPI